MRGSNAAPVITLREVHVHVDRSSTRGHVKDQRLIVIHREHSDATGTCKERSDWNVWPVPPDWQRHGTQ
jgi:hypothetical protein